jgi:hypothetical protein
MLERTAAGAPVGGPPSDSNRHAADRPRKPSEQRRDTTRDANYAPKTPRTDLKKPKEQDDHANPQVSRGGPRGARTHNPRIKRTQDHDHCGLYLRLCPHRIPHQPHQQTVVDVISCHEPCQRLNYFRVGGGPSGGIDSPTGSSSTSSSTRLHERVADLNARPLLGPVSPKVSDASTERRRCRRPLSSRHRGRPDCPCRRRARGAALRGA